MKIYFGASIRGGRSDIKIYQELIHALKSYGTVLTEHIADSNLSNKGEKSLTDQEIHDRDIQWLMEADCMVAEVTTPSLGVGYEIRAALETNKPIFCLFRTGKGNKLSAMIAGNGKIVTEQYKEIEDAKARLAEFFKGFGH